MPVTGHRMAVRYQGLLQNHNIRHDLIPREFGKWRAYIIWCTASGLFEEPFTKMSGAYCAAAAPADHARSKRQRSSENDQEICIAHDHVCSVRIVPSPRSNPGAQYRFGHRGCEGRHASRQGHNHSGAMEFSENDGAAFWPIYRQYEHERSTLDDGRVAVIKEYTEKYSTLTDAEAKAMAERMFEYDSRLAALKKKYFRKFNKVLPALTVTKFFQLERRIDLMMDMQVESSLPPLTQAQYTGQAK